GLFVSGRGFSVKFVLPARLEQATTAELEVTIWDGDGAPMSSAETVVTVTAPSGAVMGLRAKEPQPGVYRFRLRFTESCEHVLRVFLPIGDATVSVPLTVARALHAA